MKIFWRIIEIIVKIIAFVLALIAILLVIAAVSFHFFDLNAHRKIIEQQFSSLSGYKLLLNGPIEATIFPIPTFHLNDAVFEMEAMGEPLAFSAKALQFKIQPRSLFSTNLHLYDVKGKDLSIAIKNETGGFEQMFKSISGDIDTGPCTVRLSNLNILFNDKTINGNITFFNFAKKIDIDANISTSSWKVEPTGAMNFIGFLAQDNITGKLSMHLDDLLYKNLDIKDVTWRFNLGKDSANLTGKGQLPGASFEVKADVTDVKSAPKSAFELNVNVTEVKKLLETFGESIPVKSDGLTLKLSGACTGKALTELKGECVTDIKGDIKSLSLVADPNNPFLTNWSQFALQDIQFAVELQKPLTISAKGKIPDGEFTSEFWIKNWDSEPQVLTELHLTSQNSAGFLKHISPKWKLDGGSLLVDVQGRTHGKAVSDWVKKFKGHLFVHIKDMTVHEQKIDSRLVDVFALLSKGLSKSTEDTTFDCLAARFHVNEGVLLTKSNFAVETPEIYALGTGTIDIPAHLMKLSFEVFPRDKSPLHMGAYDNLVTISGSLTDPKVSASGHGLITKGGSLALGIATGGLSTLAEKFIDIIKERGSPCAKVLNEEQKVDKQSLIKAFKNS